MTETITFRPDGTGGLICSLCGATEGHVIADVVAHADWHENYDRRVWNQGWSQRGAELAALTMDMGLTPTEKRGLQKAMQRQMAAIETQETQR